MDPKKIPLLPELQIVEHRPLPTRRELEMEEFRRSGLAVEVPREPKRTWN